MKNRTSVSQNSQKTPAQDGLGIALSLLGGFFAVSVFLTLLGNSSTNALSAPVHGLIASIGPWAGLILSIGIAGLGVALFLRESAVAPGPHALGLAGLGVGLAFLLGAIQPELGGGVGSLPVALLGAVAGRILAILLGLSALAAGVRAAWLAGESVSVPKAPTTGPLVPPRRAEAEGVSTAEAQALQPQKEETFAADSQRAARDVRLDGGVPEGTNALQVAGEFDSIVEDQDLTETLARDVDLSESTLAPGGEWSEADSGGVADTPEPTEEVAESVSLGAVDEIPESPVGVSSWEVTEEEEEEYEEEEEEELEEAYAEDESGAWEEEDEEDEELEYVEEGESEIEVEDEALPEPVSEDSEAQQAGRAQSGFFDATKSAAAEPVSAADEERDVLKPVKRRGATKAPGAEKAGAGASSGPRGKKKPKKKAKESSAAEISADLILQAGELILEHNRVAVSMIQRQFDLEFDKACLILDRLQDLGLIGPYVGGRSRDILLSPEDWRAMAAEVASS